MTLRRHVCVADELECNTRKLEILRDKMQQLRALDKPLFATVSPYKSQTTDDDDSKFTF